MSRHGTLARVLAAALREALARSEAQLDERKEHEQREQDEPRDDELTPTELQHELEAAQRARTLGP